MRILTTLLIALSLQAVCLGAGLFAENFPLKIRIEFNLKELLDHKLDKYNNKERKKLSSRFNADRNR